MRAIEAHLFLSHTKRTTIELALVFGQLFLLHWPDVVIFFYANDSVLCLFINLLYSLRLNSTILTAAHFSYFY